LPKTNYFYQLNIYEHSSWIIRHVAIFQIFPVNNQKLIPPPPPHPLQALENWHLCSVKRWQHRNALCDCPAVALGWFYLVLIAGAWLARKQFLRWTEAGRQAGGRGACVCTHFSLSPPPLSWVWERRQKKVRAGWKDLFGASIRAEAAIWRSQPAFVELKRPLKGHSTSQTSRPKMFGRRRSDQPHHVLIVQQYHPPDPSEVFAFSKQTLMSTRCLSTAKNMSETCASDAISPVTRPCPNFVPTKRERERYFRLAHLAFLWRVADPKLYFQPLESMCACIWSGEKRAGEWWPRTKKVCKWVKNCSMILSKKNEFSEACFPLKEIYFLVCFQPNVVIILKSTFIDVRFIGFMGDFFSLTLNISFWARWRQFKKKSADFPLEKTFRNFIGFILSVRKVN
jgi:hypothetical protein